MRDHLMYGTITETGEIVLVGGTDPRIDSHFEQPGRVRAAIGVQSKYNVNSVASVVNDLGGQIVAITSLNSKTVAVHYRLPA